MRRNLADELQIIDAIQERVEVVAIDSKRVSEMIQRECFCIRLFPVKAGDHVLMGVILAAVVSIATV